MLTVAVTAAAVAATAVGAVLLARVRRAHADARLEAMAGELDGQMTAITQSLQRVVDRSTQVRASGGVDLELTVDFGELLRRLAVETAARTEAPAASVRVQGPGGESRAAFFGTDESGAPASAPLGAGARPFRAVTINWALDPAVEERADSFTSALVVPIVEGGAETGMLAAYARGSDSFDAEHVRGLESLSEEAATALASARRYAEAQRALTDEATGIRNRAGYEADLDRAAARAHETGLPLSLVVFRISSAESAEDAALGELAAVALRATRATDVVCRRAAAEIGIVLPDTNGEAAGRLHRRLRDEAARTTFSSSGALTLSTGLVEWRPNEAAASFDERATAAVRHGIDDLELTTRRAVGVASPAPLPREGFDEQLAHEIDRARRLAQPLTLLVIDVGSGELGDRFGTAEHALEDVEARVAQTLANGDSTCRIEAEELAVLLPGKRAAQAEALFAALRESLANDPPKAVSRLAVSAGITELAARDDALAVFDRAEHAVVQARQAGSGTVVVALPTADSRY